MEREVGGGIGMGNTCKPMAVLFQCMTKSTTIKKKEIKEQCLSYEYLESSEKKNLKHKKKEVDYILGIYVMRPFYIMFKKL